MESEMKTDTRPPVITATDMWLARISAQLEGLANAEQTARIEDLLTRANDQRASETIELREPARRRK
jgi:hypothetical protein